jgi:transposase
MDPAASFLIPPSLHVQALLLGDDGVTIRAAAEATDVRCPVCGEAADRVHSRYRRTLADLPWARFAVRFHLQVRRFFCDNPACPREIFAERLVGIAAVLDSCRVGCRECVAGPVLGTPVATTGRATKKENHHDDSADGPRERRRRRP